MKRTAVIARCCLVTLVLHALLSLRAYPASYPSWWIQRGVITNTPITNDYAAVNEGQVKHMARQAYEEMQEKIFGGAGEAVSNLVFGFTYGNNYAAMNVGQLKNVATSFFARLQQVNYTNCNSWTTTTTDDVDYAMANIGQLKQLFSFEPGQVDSDGDGMPDWWEMEHGLNPTNSGDATTDLDVDGLGNLSEYQAGSDPESYDTDQDGLIDGLDGNISTNTYPGGIDLADDGYVDGEGDAAYGTSPILADTDADGLVDGIDGIVTTNSYSSGVDANGNGYVDGEFDFGTNPTNEDTDADGMADGWEVKYGFNPLSADAVADFDGDSLSNPQESDLGTNPYNADSDGDGVSDGVDPNPTSALDSDSDSLPDDWEMFWFSNLDQTGTDNPDGDGLSNAEEFTLGTDPTKLDQNDLDNATALTVFLPLE